MDVIYYRSPSGNFGDDLNAVLWPALLPPAAFETDDAVLLGIGSIFRDDFLSGEATENRRVFVLGSGAGTGPLPKRWPNDAWSILGVRGPLTARLLERPDSAITDGAALLSITKELMPEPAERRHVAFFPHYNSVRASRWREVCDQVGLVFIDPHWTPSQVLGALAGSRLVLAEAMHGAIVADTLRIPWIPLVCSPEISSFKWTDWTMSLVLPYRPISIPASSAWEALRHRKMRLCDRAMAAGSAASADDVLIADFHARFDGALPASGTASKGRKRATAALQSVTARFDGPFMSRAAESLRAVALGASYLSEDDVFNERLERLQQALRSLRRALAV
jgi:succinoglycan biosynthesis protein ExoV